MDQNVVVQVPGSQKDDSEPTFVAITGGDDLVHLVQGHAQIQEVHVTDEQGNVQEVTYTYAANHPNASVNLDAGQQPLAAQISTNSGELDPSFDYYDNIRGKVNSRVLANLVHKYDAENPSLTKQNRLNAWQNVSDEYCQITGQNKNRTVLMKRWSSAKYYREHEGKTINEGGKTKIAASKIKEEKDDKSANVKQFKEYETLRLEAAKMERDARKVELENVLLEQESLKKENAILDLQMDVTRLEVALKKEEAIKMGIVVEVAEDVKQ